MAIKSGITAAAYKFRTYSMAGRLGAIMITSDRLWYNLVVQNRKAMSESQGSALFDVGFNLGFIQLRIETRQVSGS